MRLIVENYDLRSGTSMDTHADDMLQNLRTVFDTNGASEWHVFPSDDLYEFPVHNSSDVVLPGRYRSIYQDDLTDNRVIRTYNVIYNQYSSQRTWEIRRTFRALMENYAQYGGAGKYTRLRDDTMGIDSFFMLGQFAGFSDLHVRTNGSDSTPDLIGFTLKYNCSPRRYTINGTKTATLFNDDVTIRCSDTGLPSNPIPYASPILMLKCGTSESTVSVGGLKVTLNANVTTPCVIDFDTGKVEGISAIKGISGNMDRAFFDTIQISVTGTPGQCAILPRWYIV